MTLIEVHNVVTTIIVNMNCVVNVKTKAIKNPLGTYLVQKAFEESISTRSLHVTNRQWTLSIT